MVTAYTYFVVVVGVLMFILFIAATTLAYLNNKRFLEVCRLYEIEFGFLPLNVATFKDADVIGFSAGYGMKMEFIIGPLVFGKKSKYSKNNDVEFMRKLPSTMKSWFLAEFYCAVLGCAACAIIGICMYLDKNR